MNKIAIINQRYGLEVNGGSEYYTRQIAEKLKKYYDIEILTTRAIDYITWKNHYPVGVQLINGIPVRRFSVNNERNMEIFKKENSNILQDINHTEQQELHWIDEQGPLSEDLINYIAENSDTYDIFIFVTYLYYHTVKGLPLVADKAILIPTAHDEPYIYFKIFNRIFNIPKAIIFLTDEEKEFVHKRFKNQHIMHDVMGVGIDVPNNINEDKFRSKYNIKDDYIIYIGRIDIGKNCDSMFKYFVDYKNRNKTTDLKLVLMGKEIIEIPKHPDIISLGFVSEEDKFNGIAGAKALILPSKFESLSISVLEAMSVSVPVIVNGACEVLKAHCIKSKAGLFFNNFYEFEGILNYIFKYDGIYNQMKINSKKYITENYQWNIIVNKFINIIDQIKNRDGDY